NAKKKAKEERERKLMLIGCVIILVLIVMIFAIGATRRLRFNLRQQESESASIAESESVKESIEESIAESKRYEELESIAYKTKLDSIFSEYENLGIVDTSGFINMRREPNANDMTNIIGLLNDKAAFSLIEDLGDWYYVSSGGLEGYVASRFCVTGDKARELAEENIKPRLVILADVVNIRTEPVISPETGTGKAYKGERYEIIEVGDEWAQVNGAYVTGSDAPYINLSVGNAEVRECLDEARHRDLREQALTQFDELVVCVADSFVNVRKEPKADGISNICGKFLRGNGAELLETVEKDGTTWYKIKSGTVKGYVAAQYCVTGTDARSIALEYSSLTARINTDSLNVRTGPSTDKAVWTQVVKGQAYRVIDQKDGWVEIDLDTDDDKAFISTQNGYVTLKYGLAEAVEYYPAVEAANKAAAFRSRIVNYACQFIGNPYVWGGTSLTNGADCSGFVQSVLKNFGIKIDRTSRDQAKNGVRVTSDKMKPGDLVFYAGSDGVINHVGMYIGNGQIVNAASKRAGIKIYRWNYRTPVAIRNVIGD
ncbi:MAG: SH3 domain-containing protein, partial [Eubacteriales bacterium]|nr:SH3 domain-containing protein [Eubacteriales bacterium]